MGAEITNQTRLEPHRHYSGPEFLREGFRPLFFLAGLWAALSVPLWIGIWSGAISYPGLGDATMWHVHEMMFGYVGAALGGFVLTAVPNWTGRPPVRVWPLGALALIWLCGRIAVWWGGTVGPMPTAVADLAYLGVLSVLVGNAIVAGRNWRNLPVLAGLILMLTANVLFHLSAAGVADVGEAGVRLSIAVMSLLMALIGGRIVPSFTHNCQSASKFDPLSAWKRAGRATAIGRSADRYTVNTLTRSDGWSPCARLHRTGTFMLAEG